MKSPITIPLVLSLLSITRAWCDYRIPFDIPAPTPDSAIKLYSVWVVTNHASKANFVVRDSSLIVVADTIASDTADKGGHVGNSASVEAWIPIHTNRCSYDLRKIKAISFEYRNNQTITDRLDVMLESSIYPPNFGEAARFQTSVTGEANLSSGTAWKRATLDLASFAIPQWASGFEAKPPIDSVLRYLQRIRIAPRTTYSNPGTAGDGKACTQCTAPTMTKLTLEIRNLTLKMDEEGFVGTHPRTMGGYNYAYTFTDSSLLRDQYGIKSFSNPASSTSVTMKDGAVILSATLVDDSSSLGRIGFSAEAGVSLPYRYDRVPVDVTGNNEIEFEYRNSSQITDYLAVRIESSAIPDSFVREGKVYEGSISGKVNLQAGTTWKRASVSFADFATPSWWSDIPGEYPSFEAVMKQFRSLLIIPKPKYSDSGFDAKGNPCVRCINPTMKTQTLEIRNVAFRGLSIFPSYNPTCEDVNLPNAVHRTPSKASFNASYRDGFLQVQRLPGYGTIDVVSASGSRVARFEHGQARMSIALERGTYFAVARGAGLEPVAKRFVVVR